MASQRHAADIKSGDYAPEMYDWYVEPTWCVDLLFDYERFDLQGSVLDPACGRGTIPATALRRGFVDVEGYDIVNRSRTNWIGAQPFRFQQLNFIALPMSTRSKDYVISNPPYSYEKGIAEAFIRRALETARSKVAVLLPSKFLASQARYKLFTETPLARIYHLSSRPSMPPGHLLETAKLEQKGGKVDYCWMVWDHLHVGPTTVHWLLRKG